MRNEGTKNRRDYQSTNNQVVYLCPTRSIITLNVNWLDDPVERQKLLDWVKDKA